MPVANKRPRSFPERGKMLAWLDKFEALHSQAATEADLRWLRSVIQGADPAYANGPSLDSVLRDLQAVASGRHADHARYGDFPPDVFAQFFPGGDQPPMPVDTLVSVSDVQLPEPPPNMVVPGSMIVAKAPSGTSYQGAAMLFSVGAMVPDAGTGTDAILVEWWLPPLAPREAFRPGPKKSVPDVFGEWRAVGNMQVSELAAAQLPPPIVPLSDILEFNIQMEGAGGKLPYSLLDKLRTQHGIDVTGLATSLTHAGNLYRSYVLMAATGS